MEQENPLHRALRQLSRDIRILVDLSTHESETAWDKMIETVKREIEDESEDFFLKTLISEIYDHLSSLIGTIRRSQDRLRYLATRDLLTGLYNRNYFNESVVRDIQKAKRYQERLSFVILDIDDFKTINDTFGHVHGDGIIKECAQILRRSVRRSDFLCRFGGDEFVIVTPKGDCADNEALIERIHAHTDEWNRKFSTSNYTLSFSVGCSVWEEGRDVMEVLREADRHLYSMKKRKKQSS